MTAEPPTNVAAITIAVARASAAAAARVAAIMTAPAFALTPAQLSPNVIIDLSQKAGQALYENIIAPFKNKYDGSTRGILSLVTQLRGRAETAGWDKTTMSIFKFDAVVDAKIVHYDLLEDFGVFTLDQVVTHAMTYCNTSTRQAQNAYHMYQALITLLTAPAYKHLMSYLDQAKVRGVKNGPALFKLIISKFTIDTRSTVIVIRKILGALDQYMATIDGNLRKFIEELMIC